MTKPFLTVTELATVLNVHRNTIDNWVKSGAIPKGTYVEVPHGRTSTLRFDHDAVIAALAKTERPTEVNN
jgi:excisionase family DNA binding protein